MIQEAGYKRLSKSALFQSSEKKPVLLSGKNNEKKTCPTGGLFTYLMWDNEITHLFTRDTMACIGTPTT